MKYFILVMAMVLVIGFTLTGCAVFSSAFEQTMANRMPTNVDNSVTFTVTYDANGGIGTVPATQTFSQGRNVVLRDIGGLTRHGYTFHSWNTAPDGTGNRFPASSQYSAFRNLNLHAIWIHDASWNRLRGTSWVIPTNGSRITFPNSLDETLRYFDNHGTGEHARIYSFTENSIGLSSNVFFNFVISGNTLIVSNFTNRRNLLEINSMNGNYTRR
jgi:hypothetical protein